MKTQHLIEPRSADECNCACHRSPLAVVLHPVACCRPCPYCGRAIAAVRLHRHVERCEARPRPPGRRPVVS